LKIDSCHIDERAISHLKKMAKPFKKNG
jgi:hypothetical protein